MIDVVDERKIRLENWLQSNTPFKDAVLEIASADASFRRYFRMFEKGNSYIVMDAPPDREPCEPFIRIGGWMRDAGVRVPEIIEQDIEQGFLILSDFGDRHYREAIEGKNRKFLYDLAIEEILKFQLNLGPVASRIPVFDRAWQSREMEIFRAWCLPDLSSELFQDFTRVIVEEVDQIPKGFMHRDFHCRNLLLPEDGKPGVIDFQGAMLGPVTYDLVSLLRDCYVDNPNEWIEEKVVEYLENLKKEKILEESVDSACFLQWFDYTGLQRHLKCIGIFHRLKIRDGKSSYLNDIPRVLKYVEFVLNRHPKLSGVRELVQQASILR